MRTPWRAAGSTNEEPPLRADLFSTEQMERHGVHLANTHRVAVAHAGDRLLARLADNEAVLVETCALLTTAVGASHRITPAGEWLLDNLYLVEEQIRTAKRHLPKGYGRSLPILDAGVSQGLPRVYDIALETIAHGDGRVHPETLRRFVTSYQTVTPLRLGELWAVPIMLRLALVENLRRVAVRIATGRADRNLAAAWAGKLAKGARDDPKNLILVIADMARSDPPMTTPFVSELARRLQGQGPTLALALTWIEQHLAESGLSIERVVRSGNQLQAADQVSISNSIGSLRVLGATDWGDFVESTSLVEGILRSDPAGAYASMDFTSRDGYRHAIEGVAKAGGLPEDVVAARAVELAVAAGGRLGRADRTAHVGFYLVDGGRPALDRIAGVRPNLVGSIRRGAARRPLMPYLGAITLLTAFLTWALVRFAYVDGTAGWVLMVLGVLAVFAASQLAVTLVNALAHWLAPPHRLPRMDFSEGIPPESRALVVVPSMLMSPGGVEHLVEALEVRFLANRDDNLSFALLTDWRDAAEETRPDDEALVRLAKGRIDALNARYAREAKDIFFLFHRPRSWNPEEGVWMGRERKRGKLGDLNTLLLQGNREAFSTVVGDTGALTGVRYVITLDTDTELPRDAARRMVGAMAHPLHRPVHDQATQAVQAGYGILQPRVSPSLPGTLRSRYARLMGGDAGIDPYTRAVSDVYQDVFKEGSFIGKGIYDVAAFERSLAGRFPANRVLSHDLLEGCHARAGLLSDVQLYEENPARYGADVDRRYRWIRGDWQLVGWLLPWVPTVGGRRRSHLSALSRWKLFDNLRRSLVPGASTLLLLLGWTALAHAWLWTASVMGIFLLPPVVAALVEALRRPDDMRPGQHLAAAAEAAGNRFLQTGFLLVSLPHEAWYSTVAILRTLGRLLFTHRRLLEWNPSRSQERSSRTDLAGSFRSMWFAPVLAAGAGAFLAWTRPGALGVAGPLLVLWLVSPVVAWWISVPVSRRDAGLTAPQRRFLGGVARKTWAFFETCVGPDDNWLPPDNYQASREDPLAHRTSPTNMGLALLANLSAYDLGYIPVGHLLERTGQTLGTMGGLARYCGHFFNWYDTRTLVPLRPAYVSTVDSGNLAGHLLTLRPGLLELLDGPILPARWLDGLLDTMDVLEAEAPSPSPALLARLKVDLVAARGTPPVTLPAVGALLHGVAVSAVALATELERDPESRAAPWAHALARQCRALRDEVDFLAPWAGAPQAGSRSGAALDGIPTLRVLANLDRSGAEPMVLQGALRARERMEVIRTLAARAAELADVEYGFLYDKASRLLTIGYNTEERRRDAGSYDLLASEARLGVFVAIAQGKLPQESWFALGRLLTTAGGAPILMSWSGSMFEYLMPHLVMPLYHHTLLDQTAHAAVARQMEYGRQLRLPWGMSESGYNQVDAHLNYQYRAFGVPGLGLKRGLSEDVVVAPYASALALLVTPVQACLNLQRLVADGADGPMGLHEAIDYTVSRQRHGESSVVVRSYMAHHQGMSLLSLAHVLLDGPMQRRFASDPMFQASLLLLHERIPRATARYALAADQGSDGAVAEPSKTPIRVLDTPHTRIPEVQLLSNGRYHVMVTNAGGGYSRWRDLAVTRWREDGTRDNWGTFCYLRDAGSGRFWSTAHQPARRKADGYEAIFSEGRAEFRRRDGDFDTHTEIVVSPEDDIELRRVHITNRSRTRRTVEVTSYAEVVLAEPDGDTLHPAFSNLFVQTEILETRRAILCTRRPRSRSESAPWMFHLMAAQSADGGHFSFETDRAAFRGRGLSAAEPTAMAESGMLAGGEGSVLDPVVAIRCLITLEPEASASVDLVYGVGESRAQALHLVDKYQDRRLADRVFELAWTHAQVVLRQLDASAADAQLYARLANSVLFANPALRAEQSVLMRNRRGQSGLWGYAISGDLPIVLLRIHDLANIELARQLIQAHAYWRLKGLAVDLVIWNEDRAGYRQLLQDQILDLVAVGVQTPVLDRPGGIFVRSAEQISEEDRTLFQTVARAVLTDAAGTLEEQVGRAGPPEVRMARLEPSRKSRFEPGLTSEAPGRDLILHNGLGGFTPDGREYVITTTPLQRTPAPWSNVLANPGFGTVISESGQAYTWGENAHEFRLTPWHNDPVSDEGGEAFYLRDEDTGRYWSPTPLPTRGPTPYVTRHGFGYSVFEHDEEGIHSELWVYVAKDAAIKFSLLKVRNTSDRTRRLSATGYVEWVLGDIRERSATYLTTEVDPLSQALLARNPYNGEFPRRVAFFDVDDPERTMTCDRTEFIGRNGSLGRPAAMERVGLSGRVGAGLDPCAAIQVPFELAPGQEREITFRLGLGGTPGGDDVDRLLQRFRGPAAARQELEAVWHYWNHTLGAVQVDTPDESLNVLTNGWLLYQTLACRLWARSGYYQSGGAYGFRDQLQDAMALVHTEPRLLRDHLLLCAGRQFTEGDVQHWWHPPVGRGVRTHCSDDYLWLALATCRYVSSTGDTGVLDEPVRYLDGRPLSPDDDSYYDLPGQSGVVESLYLHCVRAIRRGFGTGLHGLPLIGTGDWNDGMNRVGMGGQGESVWLAFFQSEVLRRFSAIARQHDDPAFADQCLAERERLRAAIELHGWDGAWYRRAYFDDGTPLGSAQNEECRIDSISQSWSVLSGVADPQRARAAMDAMDARLVRRDHGLIQLLDPPFDKSDVDPGYIKGYVPGVRENGGQYTHSAIWAAMAFAALGDSERAWELATMINPANHATTLEGIETYKVEPYVAAADVYAVEPHTGRGGWTWYTGSAGWMYRLILESLLGLRLEREALHFEPCLPAHWADLKVHYRYRETVYHVTIVQTPAGADGAGDEPRITRDGAQDGPLVTLDGVQLGTSWLPLVDDQREHAVEVRVGPHRP